jgi:imidazolonepropionase
MKCFPEIARTNSSRVYRRFFCETGYFTVAETEQIMEVGIRFGLKPKIHVNQFNSIEGFKQP